MLSKHEDMCSIKNTTYTESVHGERQLHSYGKKKDVILFYIICTRRNSSSLKYNGRVEVRLFSPTNSPVKGLL